MKIDRCRRLKSGKYRSKTTFTTFSVLSSRLQQRNRNVNRLFPQFHFHPPRVDSPFYNPRGQFSLAMSEKKVVRIENRSDRWRFVCPRGHRSWEPTNHHFWCQKCSRCQGVDGVFHELHDHKTGENFEREHIRLVTAVGPYDRDLDRRGQV
jgi:hypothetical protein